MSLYFQLNRTDGRVRVWRQPHESMYPTCQQGTAQAGEDSVMVRGVCSWCDMGPLIRLDTTLTALYSSIILIRLGGMKDDEKLSDLRMFTKSHDRATQKRPAGYMRPAVAGERCTLNLSRAQTSSRWCGVVVRRERYQLRSRPRHLTMVKNYEVCRQKPSRS
ncbi:transposable element Tcb2 transposase [Trichonephila clavipes]|nr:transposable element Tcb2 transposase [Trichonephila clavipes]